jgi:hypothetical protein
MEIIYRTHIKKAFDDAIISKSKINDEILSIHGMTGVYTRHFYNNLLNMDDARYLEIGTWAGSSVCSAMFKNKAKVVCVDNWSQYDGPKETFLNNFDKFKGENNASFIERDCYSIDVTTLPKFNIYLYDGDHSHESHYKALSHFYDCLDDIFIYIVDDWNWHSVRNGTNDAISNLNLEVLYDKEVRLTWNEDHTPMDIAHRTWWNGIYVAVLKKRGV